MRVFLPITLIALLLLSSMGFHVSMHLCGGTLKDFAIMGKAEPCEHAKPANTSLPTCHPKTVDLEATKGSCCQDRMIEIHTLDKEYLGNSHVASTCSQISILTAKLHPDRKPISFYQLSVEYLCYKPPLLVGDIPISIQSILV